MKNCLSSFKSVVKDGRLPLPMMVAVIVKPKESAMRYHEWVEFSPGFEKVRRSDPIWEKFGFESYNWAHFEPWSSPFEIGMAKYGTFMKTEDFGSQFFMGAIVKPRFDSFSTKLISKLEKFLKTLLSPFFDKSNFD